MDIKQRQDTAFREATQNKGAAILVESGSFI